MNKILPCFSFHADIPPLRIALSKSNTGVFGGKFSSFSSSPVISNIVSSDIDVLLDLNVVLHRIYVTAAVNKSSPVDIPTHVFVLYTDVNTIKYISDPAMVDLYEQSGYALPQIVKIKSVGLDFTNIDLITQNFINGNFTIPIIHIPVVVDPPVTTNKKAK